MQTNIRPDLRYTPQGREADAILRKCVHCGFCNATCPTYQVKGDELDGPRGRIYLMKQMLEGEAAGGATLTHLDRCLTCRNCETTCPSGVEYGRLLDIGRDMAEHQIARPWGQRLLRHVLGVVLTRSWLFGGLLALGRMFKPLLPGSLSSKIPAQQPSRAWPPLRHARRMLVLQGCVQPTLAPQINTHAAQLLDQLGVSLIPIFGCCGAIEQHLSLTAEAAVTMRRNIDAWWPAVESGVEAIVMTASGCGVQVKDYGHYLRDDPVYAAKAARIAALTRDVAEVLKQEDLSKLRVTPRKVAYQAPCSLQHGQKLPGVVEGILQGLGFKLEAVADAYLCCGSAGAYSLLQPELSTQLRDNKLAALGAGEAELFATANIGCLNHLQSGTSKRVVHWLELLVNDDATNRRTQMNTENVAPLLQYSFPRLNDGSPQALSQYAGKVLLVVNVASECGLTPQYAGLQRLYSRYRDQGLVVLGFPSNEFGGQEPGSEQQIAQFCSSHFGVDFPMLGKTTVTAGNANPFYAALAQQTGESPQWNFHKYLIGRSGSKVQSFGSRVVPEDAELLAAIEEALAE
jgi:glycolate oxidase iron-sulfur subunit